MAIASSSLKDEAMDEPPFNSCASAFSIGADENA
jgi:hypothetical protein